MKRVLLLLVALLATMGMAQEKSIVTVKNSEASGVVILVNVQQVDPVPQGKATFVLQCNKGMRGCIMPAPGSYVMVRLPENFGMYECRNVSLYPADADPNTTEPIGHYCLTEK